MTTPRRTAIVAEANVNRGQRLLRLLENLDCTAVIVRNGDEVVPLFRRSRTPSFALINLMLPRVDGFTVIERIRNLGLMTPIVALAPIPTVAETLKRRNLEAVDVLLASATDEQIKTALERAIRAAPHPIAEPGAAGALPPQTSDWAGDAQELARTLVASFEDVAIAIVRLTIEGQGYLGASGRPERLRFADRRAFDLPLLDYAGELKDTLLVPDLRVHPTFSETSIRLQRVFRGVCEMPLVSRGRHFGVVSLFDFQPLEMDAAAIDRLAATVRAAAAELDRTVSVAAAENELASVRRELAARRFDTAARTAKESTTGVRDSLTGLLNRRGGEEALEREAARVARSGGPLGLAVFDVDHFKALNDAYGPAVGDSVLRHIGGTIATLRRGADVAVRWGGDEFLVLLPDTDKGGARRFSQRVREAVGDSRVPDGPPITVSSATDVTGDYSTGEIMANLQRLVESVKQAPRTRLSLTES